MTSATSSISERHKPQKGACPEAAAFPKTLTLLTQNKRASTSPRRTRGKSLLTWPQRLLAGPPHATNPGKREHTHFPSSIVSSLFNCHDLFWSMGVTPPNAWRMEMQ